LRETRTHNDTCIANRRFGAPATCLTFSLGSEYADTPVCGTAEELVQDHEWQADVKEAARTARQRCLERRYEHGILPVHCLKHVRHRLEARNVQVKRQVVLPDLLKQLCNSLGDAAHCMAFDRRQATLQKHGLSGSAEEAVDHSEGELVADVYHALHSARILHRHEVGCAWRWQRLGELAEADRLNTLKPEFHLAAHARQQPALERHNQSLVNGLKCAQSFARHAMWTPEVVDLDVGRVACRRIRSTQ